MTRRMFLKVISIGGFFALALKGNLLANTYPKKFIKYIKETSDGYELVLSDGSSLFVNQTGLYVIGRLEQGASINEIVNELSEITKKDKVTIREDIEVFLNNLKVLKII
ncbi:MAG: PqqD family protein [candidate division WOR-3 bacterium]